MMLGMGPKECLLSVICFAKLDVSGLCLKAVSCSLKRVANFLPVLSNVRSMAVGAGEFVYP